MKIGEVPQGVDSTRTKLSICVVTWNSESVIRSCLQAIYNDSMSGDWELFVVDNGSTDSTVGIVREEFPRAILLEPGENLGFSRANNLALTRAAGEFLLLLNPDTEPRPGALGKLVDFMQQESEVGIGGPRLIRPSGKLELSCGRSPTMIREIGRKLLLHRVFPFLDLAAGITRRDVRSDGLPVPALWFGAKPALKPDSSIRAFTCALKTLIGA